MEKILLNFWTFALNEKLHRAQRQHRREEKALRTYLERRRSTKKEVERKEEKRGSAALAMEHAGEREAA